MRVVKDNSKVEVWRDALGSEAFRITRTKTENMMCNFRKNRRREMALRYVGRTTFIL